MDYKRIYDQLVEKAKPRGLDKSKHEGYFEIHHIVPRCMGGGDEKENLVMFTGREHFIAHMLLWKAYPEEVSLMRSAFLMSSRKRGGAFGEDVVPINSKTYETLRKEYSEAVRVQVAGENNPFYGKTHNEETRKKLREWHANNPDHTRNVFLGRKHTEESKRKMSEARKGGVNSEETRKKISEANKGRVKSPEWVEKLRIANTGKKRSPEARKSISEGKKGIPWTDEARAKRMENMKYGEEHHSYGIPNSPETRQKISKALRAKEYRPWENPTCNTPEHLDKWYLADYYYGIWEHFGGPGFRKLHKIYNYINEDDISLTFLAVMCGMFRKGWNPHEDEKWVAFEEEYGRL